MWAVFLLTDRVLQQAVGGEDPALCVQRSIGGTQEDFGWKGPVRNALAGQNRTQSSAPQLDERFGLKRDLSSD